MKKIVSGNELLDKMKEAIDILCNTVKVTLGPKCNNVIIDHSTFSPFITNDGVTIAQNIESEDEVINTILTLSKEASIKTNENVGDGTTTTLVLLQGIFNEGLNLIKNGKNPIILKKELDISLDNIINKLVKFSKKPTNKDLLNIANISSNDLIIGNNIYEAYINTNSINAINIKEWNNDYTKLEYLKGYSFETIIASNYFFNDNKEIVYNDTNILVVDNNIDDIEQISTLINNITLNNKSLVIIANDYSDYFINDIVNLYMDNELNICLLKSPEYGYKQIEISKDIASICNTKVINSFNNLNNIGYVKSISINNETTTLSFINNESINKRINELNNELMITTDLEFLEKRIAMFTKKLAIINIGASTNLERRELKMRYIDALHSIDTAKKGILPGEGLSLLKIQNEIDDSSDTNILFKKILNLPFITIMDNAGLDSNKILDNIKKNNFNKIYNIYESKYESINNTNIVDPTYVVINSIKNATSIASMLLTTSNLIINEYKNNLNKINDYNEL